MRYAGWLIALCLVSACGGEQTGSETKTIGVSLLDQTNDFFKSLEAGLRKEAAKHGYRLIVQSAEADPTIQARHLEDFVTQQVDAIVVTPCNSDTVYTNLRDAQRDRIPVFTADIAAHKAKIVAHIASDNVQGGRKAGQRMGELLGGKGEVLIIDHPTVSSVQDRTKGFREALGAHPDIRIVGSPSAEGQRAKAQSVMEDALTVHPKLNGVFAINDVSALGALRAIEAAGRTDMVVIGYDAVKEAVAAIKRGGPFKASVKQDPELIGSTTIATIAKHFAGEKFDPFIPVDVGLVD
ncbi:MAG: substrate-binding domain-containing protein [Planctomycetota bacterium]|jgi:ribose transport system substrate-binding protein